MEKINKEGGRENMVKENNVKVEVTENPYGMESMEKLVKHLGPWASHILYQVITGKDVYTGQPIDALGNLTNALLAKVSNHGYKG